MIRKVVIPSAGLGTRLLPATKQQPKEMLPVFAKDEAGYVFLKPVVQIVFERLHEAGFRDFYFVVGRGKRSIEDQFTVDKGFMEDLKRYNKSQLFMEMRQFYNKVSSSSIVFINQPEPLGFGDAVLRVKMLTGQEPFLVHAGDDLIMSRNTDYFARLVNAFEAYKADVTFCVQKVSDPRKYGVMEGDRIGAGIYKVKHVKEKPLRPKSRMAIVALYAFNSKIYHYIEKVRGRQNRELELTDAIEALVNDGGEAYAVELRTNETRIDVGTPQSYWNALRLTAGN